MADFDWVKARSDCSLGLIFEDIRAGVQDDINKRNALDKYGQYKIAFAQGRVSVIHEVEPGLVKGVIRFTLANNALEVREVRGNGEETFKLRATPTLNEKGECRLWVNDKEMMEIWYFRKTALEGLFFE